MITLTHSLLAGPQMSAANGIACAYKKEQWQHPKNHSPQAKGLQMRKLFLKFWHDDCGAVGPEWMCIMTVLVLGSVAALLAARQTLVHDVQTAAQIAVSK
jgi:hypothetical protein